MAESESSSPKMRIPAMPLELCLIMEQISGVVEKSMMDLAQKNKTEGVEITITKIADILFGHCGFPTSIPHQNWSFCDLLFVRFFDKVHKKFLAGRAFILHCTCFLTYLSLASKEELIRVIVDIYSSSSALESPPGFKSVKSRDKVAIKKSKGRQSVILNSRSFEDKLSMKTCETIFNDMMAKACNASTSLNQKQISEKLDMLMEYHNATSCLQSTPGPAHSSNNNILIRTFVNFCVKIHPTVAWPVLMMQKQLRVNFLGDKFWNHQTTSDFCKFFNMSTNTRSVFWFIEIMSKVYPISNKKIIENKDDSTDTLLSFISRKKTSKLFPKSMFAVSTTTRSQLGPDRQWKECQAIAVRWSRKPTVHSDVYTYSRLSALSSHDRLSQHYARDIKKSKHKKKTRQGSRVLMKPAEIQQENAKKVNRRFFLERGDSTSSSHGFVTDCDSDDENSVVLDSDHNPNKPKLPLYLSTSPSSTNEKQPVPPRSPPPSPLSRPPLSRKLSDKFPDDDTSPVENGLNLSTPHSPTLHVANLKPQSPSTQVSRPPFVRKKSSGSFTVDSTSADIDCDELPSILKNSSSFSPPPELPTLLSATLDKTSVNIPSMSMLSLDNFNLRSTGSLASTSSESSLSWSHADCLSEDNTPSDNSSEFVAKGNYNSIAEITEIRGKVDEKIKNLRVLIIEDTRSQRKLMTRRLMKVIQMDKADDAARWPVESATSGEVALELIENVNKRSQEGSGSGCGYDVLIVDEELNGSGGVLMGHEIIALMRKREEMSKTLMIGCTANIDLYGETFLQAGANAVWEKPMQDALLVRECLETLLTDMMRKEDSKDTMVIKSGLIPVQST